ncbi:MAG: EcsC family protein [Clostridia bacterium]|nr:EcsC family protein [Clostridia bacterium]
MRKTPWEKEWIILQKNEEKYGKKRKDGPTSLLLMRLERIIPKKLSGALDFAFLKAFRLIFEKGTWLIEKTYNRKKKETDFKVNTYASRLNESGRNVRVFRRKAKASKLFNIFISLLEGILMGVLGFAIPDIPVFVSMVLKSVYEVALSYGYSYDTDNEKVFVLKIIEVAMCDEEEFVEKDRELNAAIDHIASHGDIIGAINITKEDQIKGTSRSLVKEMIYTKFIQQFMIVGLFGGLFDPAYISRISTYAELKYRRRFLGKKLNEEKKY